MQLKKLVSIIIIAQFAFSCSVIYKNRKPERIEIEMDANPPVNYSTPIPYKVVAYYSNGKSWDISSQNNLKLEVNGGEYSKKHITPTTYPIDFNDSILSISCSYQLKNILLNDSLKFPYNYHGHIKLDFSGKDGKEGQKGSKGSLNFLTRDGTNGSIGLNGEDGENGHDLTIYLWKIKSVFFIRINDHVQQKNYFYKAIEEDINLLELNIAGGNGGKGGDGAKGKDGKDAEIKNDKLKRAGNGGDGGSGGNGGNGGDPGNVTVFIHPSALGFEKRIKIFEQAGMGGKPGEGGLGGDGGNALNSEEVMSNGLVGEIGAEGIGGSASNFVTMDHKEFSIQSVQPK
ncbi:MAG: hypothetical protein AB8B74_13660 [Crocinitomicaceae bacterium]